jgi:nanoRNase/pAp phosphatase (c-di-AMP/oligoRNAs hydrolase)
MEVGAPYSFASRVGHLLAEISGSYGATWYLTGGTVNVSLRSAGESCFDVSELAAAYGGGGHKTAAGFKVSVAA